MRLSAPGHPAQRVPGAVTGWRRYGSALRAVAALGVLAVVAAFVEPAELWRQLRTLPAWAFGVPSALLLLNSGVHALRLRVVLGRTAVLSDLLRAVLIGNFVGLWLPTGGGEAAKVLTIGQLVGGSRAMAALLTLRALEAVPWGLLVLWAAVGVLPGRLDAAVLPAWLVGVGFVVGGLGVLFGAGQFGRWFPKVDAAVGLRASPKQLGIAGLLALPFAAVNCLVVYLLLRAVGHGLPYTSVLGIVPAADVIISLPISVAGLGVREATFATALAPFGVGPEAAVLVATLRWSGEVFRSLVGGLWWTFGASPNRHADVAESSRSGGADGMGDG